MSYGIIRIQKFTAGSCGGIQIHDERRKEYSHTNKDIDWDRSYLNYDLHLQQSQELILSQNKSFRSVANDRIKELDLTRAVRKDAIVMAQALITSDSNFFKDLSQEKQQEFFKKSYGFVCDRYGKENIISAWVHLDEKTPHMHVNFVPVTDDGKLSAKRLFSRNNLRDLQDKFYSEVCSVYGLQRGEVGSKKRHLPVLEYKAETLRAEIADLEGKKTEIDFKAIRSENKALEIESGVKLLERQQNERERHLNALERHLKSTGKILKIKNDFQRENLNKKPKFGKQARINYDIKVSLSEIIDEYNNQTDKFKHINKRASEIENSQEALKKEWNSFTSFKSNYENQKFFDDKEREKREKELAEKEKQAKETLEKVQKSYNAQLNINKIADFWLNKSKSLEKELAEHKDLNASLSYLNTSLGNENKNLVQNHTQELNALKTAYNVQKNDMAIIIAAIAQAVGMLKYNKNGDYLADLTPKQSVLIDAIADYAAGHLRQLGQNELANEIDKTVKFSKGISECIERLTPKRQISQEHQGPSLGR